MLDTNVVVAGLRSPTGASAAVIRAARHRRFELMLSAALAFEYEAVCRAPKHLAAMDLTLTELDQFFAVILAVALPVEPYFRWRPQLNDPDDEMVLEAAINGSAKALVTHNVRDFRKVSDRFALQVMTPVQFLEALRDDQ